MASLALGSPVSHCGPRMVVGFKVSGSGGAIGEDGGVGGFPPFLPKEVNYIRDPCARTLAQRIQRLPVTYYFCVFSIQDSRLDSSVVPAPDGFQVGFSESSIMSSCVVPKVRNSDTNPVVLLHCFDSSCLEWRTAYPLLEEAGLEAWAIDVLGWGFSDLETRPPCNVAAKRYHLYQLWKSYIKRPMVLVGPSLGASVAIDFAVNFPEAVDKLVLINASVYSKGTGYMTKLPKTMAYAMASVLKSIPIRLYANVLAFDGISLARNFDYMNVGRLHSFLPWWKDATVNFMLSGGYNVTGQIKQVKQMTLLICSKHDKIISNKFAEKLHTELPNASMQKLPGCGHMPHVDKPNTVSKLIVDFARSSSCEERRLSYVIKDFCPENLHIV